MPQEEANIIHMSRKVENCASAEACARIEALQRYGFSLQQMGELNLAVSVYQRALELGGDSPDIRFNIGAARLKQIRPTEALEQF